MVTFDLTKMPITQVADYIIIQASTSGASDIHFDPRDNGLMIRIRIDGELRDYTVIPKAYERNLTTRLKLLANMNITETRLPQDGAIKGKYGDKYLDMRVSCLPTNEGEKIVIRILDYTRSLEGLNSLGFSKENYKKLERMIHEPNGIILITGATGTGKSTTVYSILQTLNDEKTNIITVEDPIEMNIEGMNQVQVNSEIGLDFATVLRSILRQDPNVILIGEIRDSETAKIAVRASITGHLVLSTIHTNNSLSTIERLLDMDVERYLLSSALTGIISQRLTKRLCPHCKYRRKTTLYEHKIFKIILGKDIEEISDAHPEGCPHCNKGYRGRIAIQEVLEIEDEIKTAMNDDNLSKEKLRQIVFDNNNVITLLQDGLLKVLEEKTSFEEIYKNIDIDSSEAIDNYRAELAEATKLRIEELSKKQEQPKKDNIEKLELITEEKSTSSETTATTTNNENLPTQKTQSQPQPQITEEQVQNKPQVQQQIVSQTQSPNTAIPPIPPTAVKAPLPITLNPQQTSPTSAPLPEPPVPTIPVQHQAIIPVAPHDQFQIKDNPQPGQEAIPVIVPPTLNNH